MFWDHIFRQASLLTSRFMRSSSSAQGPARYIFSSVGVQTMVLAPLAGNWDASPLYYISWREEYFSPGSLVTTIYKGANEHAPFLAEFG